MDSSKNLLIIDGPSAVGKSTIVNYILDNKNEDFEIARRVTTRNKRKSNEDDQTYDFIDQNSFKEMIDKNELVEYKDYLFGMSYGLPEKNVLKCFEHGNHAVGIINLGNIKMVKKKFPAAFGVFINTSLETIKRRLEERTIHSAEQINERLENARAANKVLGDYDLVIINENKTVEETVKEILHGFSEHNKKNRIVMPNDL
jgi:guanylate kinase